MQQSRTRAGDTLIQNAEFGIGNGCESIQNAEFRMQNSRCRMATNQQDRLIVELGAEGACVARLQDTFRPVELQFAAFAVECLAPIVRQDSCFSEQFSGSAPAPQEDCDVFWG